MKTRERFFVNGGKRCREKICVRACLFYILNNEVLRKVIVKTRKIIDSNDMNIKYGISLLLVGQCGSNTQCFILGSAFLHSTGNIRTMSVISILVFARTST